MVGSFCLLPLLALRGFEPLHAAGLKHEEGAAIVADDGALLGEEGRALLRVAAVIDEHAEQHAVRLPLADMEDEAALEAVEAAGLHDVGDEVGAHFVRPAIRVCSPSGPSHAPIRVMIADTKSAIIRKGRNSAQGDMPAAFITISSESFDSRPIGMHDRDHQRDRRDHEHQHRNDQAGDAEKDQHGLAAAGHQVDVAQGLGDPDHRSQAEQDDRKGAEGGAEDVAADRVRTRERWMRDRKARQVGCVATAAKIRQLQDPKLSEPIRRDVPLPSFRPRVRLDLWHPRSGGSPRQSRGAFMIDSQNGPAKAKLLKMHRKKLIRGQDLGPCGFRTTIRPRSGSIMVNECWNRPPDGADGPENRTSWVARISIGALRFRTVKEGRHRPEMTGR